MLPLDGLVVLNLTRLLPGDATVGMLASFGAGIVPLKLPEVDLKTPAGKAILLERLERADVLIESFRPGVMRRFGLDYETLRARNPRLIYVAITGFGQTGQWSGMAGHDVNYLSLAGVLDVTGVKDGCPVIPGVQIADLAGGAMSAVIGILLALEARRRTGCGQMVDVSMHQGSLWMMAIPFLLQASGRATARGDAFITGRYACYHLYEAADGRWLAVGALEQKFWVNLCRELGCEEFIADQFTEGPRRQEIIEGVAAIFRTRPAAEWFERLEGCDACVTPVRSVAEVVREFGGKVPVIPRLGGVEE